MSYTVVFFFYKQKTAYDMRISDWSSDVCFFRSYRYLRSPNQTSHHRFYPQRSTQSCQWMREAMIDCLNEKAGLRLSYPLPKISSSRVDRPYQRSCFRLLHKIEWHYLDQLKIGRASCRERVCEYV